MIRLVSRTDKRLLEPSDSLVVFPPLDQVRADVVIRIPECRVNRDGLLALVDGLVDFALKVVSPAEVRVRLGRGVQLDRSFIELRRQFQVALHLQPVGVLVELPCHRDSRVRHADVV